MSSPCLVAGIGGASGSGKTTLCRALLDHLGTGTCAVLEMDRYYRDLGHLAPAERASRNFDAPEALDVELLIDHVAALARGEPVRLPTYDFASHTRTGPGELLEAPRVLLVEGIFCLVYEELRQRFDWSIFIATPDRVCLYRRLVRDVRERGRTADQVLLQYARFVQPAAERIVLPSARHADRIVSGTRSVGELCTQVAADLANAQFRGTPEGGLPCPQYSSDRRT